MSLLSMTRQCIRCHNPYHYNPSIGDLGLVCRYCGHSFRNPRSCGRSMYSPAGPISSDKEAPHVYLQDRPSLEMRPYHRSRAQTAQQPRRVPDAGRLRPHYIHRRDQRPCPADAGAHPQWKAAHRQGLRQYPRIHGGRWPLHIAHPPGARAAVHREAPPHPEPFPGRGRQTRREVTLWV